MWIKGFIVETGWLILPIILFSIFSLAIIFERILFYPKITFNASSVLTRVFVAIRKKRIAEAIDICERTPFHSTNILKAGLVHYSESKEVIRESMENASLYEIPKLEKNLNFLSTIAQVSPLIGLLGTVIGMIECFEVVKVGAAAVGTLNPSDLAGGISKALNSTAAGLCVAIPTYLAYNYFVHRVNTCVLEMERGSTELLEILSERSYVGEV